MEDFFDNIYYRTIKQHLIYLGQYPYQETQSRAFYLSLLLISITTLIIPQLYQLSHSIRDQDIDLVIMSLPPLFTNGVCFIKLFNLQINRDKFRNLFDLIKEEWESTKVENEMRILKEFAEEGCKFGRLYRTYIFLVLFVFALVPLVPISLDVVAPLNESRQRILMYEVDYLVDNDEYFYPIYVHALWSSFCSVLILVTVDTMYMLITHHVCGLFALCGYRVRTFAQDAEQSLKIYGETEENVLYEKLRQCIVAHKNAIEFADFMEQCSRMSYLLQVGLNMVAISITGVQTVMKLQQIEEATRYAVFTIAQNIHLFFNSLPGQKLLDYSVELSETIFHSEWYTVPARMQKLIIMMQIRCRNPCKLTAGSMYEMNIENFGIIVKTSMSYFTMFLSLRS